MTQVLKVKAPHWTTSVSMERKAGGLCGGHLLGLCPSRLPCSDRQLFILTPGRYLLSFAHFLWLNFTFQPFPSRYSQAIKPQGEDLSLNDSHSFSDQTKPVTPCKKLTLQKVIRVPLGAGDMCCNKGGGFSCFAKEPSMCTFKFNENSSKLKNVPLGLKTKCVSLLPAFKVVNVCEETF